MLKKLINTLKYGSSKTKRKLYGILGLFVVGAALLILAILREQKMLGLAAFLVFLADGLILLNTSFAQKSVSVATKEKPEREKKQPTEDEPGALEWISSEKKEKKKKEEPEDEPGALEWISSEKKEKKKKEKKRNLEEVDKNFEELEEKNEKIPEAEETQNLLLQYDEKKLKKIMVAYKVKKHHVTVMIDSCRAEHIEESPAYVWKDASYLYFLVFAEEPKLIKSPLLESSAIHIHRGILARPKEEYQDFNVPSPVNLVFGSLLPKYYKVENGSYRTEYKKNRYSAAPGIWCTAASVKYLLKLLPNHFILDNNKAEQESEYYQQIYIARLMYWDGIYTAQEYKEKVLESLSVLAKAELSEYTVKEYLSAMMQKGLIPREYADYVLKRRK